MNNEQEIVAVDVTPSTVTNGMAATVPKSKVVNTAILQKKLGSKFAKVIPSFAYNPAPKPPSSVDKHRADVAQRKAGIV